MKRTHQCPKCASTDIIADAYALDRSAQGNNVQMVVATFRNPDALLFKGRHETGVSACVCATCGFIELYADDPALLKQAGGS